MASQERGFIDDEDPLVENTLGLLLFSVLDEETKNINMKLTRDLIEQGADIHTVMINKGMNVLEVILSEWIQGDYDEVTNLFPFMQFLIDTGLNLDSLRSETSPLIVAAAAPNKLQDDDRCEWKILKQKRYNQVIQTLINCGSSLEAIEPYNGENAILVAVSHDIITALLERGANINVCNESGQTPLMLACKNLDITLVQLCLENHANPSLQCHFGWTATKYASYSAFSFHDKNMADPVIKLISRYEAMMVSSNRDNPQYDQLNER